MRAYTQLTQDQRYQIQVLLKMGHPYSEIADVVGAHKSTTSREVRWNCGLRGHRPRQTHRLTLARRQTKACRRIATETWHLVERLLGEQWSPEEISGWLRCTQAGPISHEWIYQSVLRDKHAQGTLYRHLGCQKQRRKRYGAYSCQGVRPVGRGWPARAASASCIARCVFGTSPRSPARSTSRRLPFLGESSKCPAVKFCSILT